MIALFLSLAMADSVNPCQTDIACLNALHAEPTQTRNPDLYRFSDPAIRDAQWTHVHVFRLLQVDTEPHVQRALMAILQQQDLTPFETELLSLISHPDSALRTDFVELIPQFSSSGQTTALTTLYQDDNLDVRESVQRVVARHLGDTHPEILLAGLTDPQERVRIQAVKGLGWHGIAFSIDDAVPLLQSSDPRVKVSTIRAIERAMPQSLGKHPIFESLTNDPNSKVQREIQRFYPQ